MPNARTLAADVSANAVNQPIEASAAASPATVETRHAVAVARSAAGERNASQPPRSSVWAAWAHRTPHAPINQGETPGSCSAAPR